MNQIFPMKVGYKFDKVLNTKKKAQYILKIHILEHEMVLKFP